MWTYWYENGQKASEGAFKDGAESGFWTLWTENGEKYKGLIHKGIHIVAFNPDGKTFASAGNNTIFLFDIP